MTLRYVKSMVSHLFQSIRDAYRSFLGEILRGVYGAQVIRSSYNGRIYEVEGDYTRSITVAIPIPSPIHMVISAKRPFVLPILSSVVPKNIKIERVV
jgi:hypothetical protein